ncbi:MAG: inorganic phosphate transporter [Frankiaceae bacterium]
MHDVGLWAIVLIALFFDFTNGFHDSANAIASSISTRALTPRLALAIAAVFNLLGALVSTKVAKTIGSGIIEPALNSHGLVIVAAALLGAITWNLITWYFGLPSSSSHALIGGLIGAGLASSTSVKWQVVWEKVVIPMVVSPTVGFVGGAIVMLAILWLFHRARPHPVNRSFRLLQPLAAAFISFSHGTQDAQKTMGVITLALLANGNITEFEVPLWVKFAAAGAIAFGTYSGGWRIIRTLGRRVIKMDPPRGFATDITAATVLFGAAHVGAPVSTTHVITSTIMGVGSTHRLSAVRWGIARSIVAAWILTLPAAGAVAALIYWILHPLFG